MKDKRIANFFLLLLCITFIFSFSLLANDNLLINISDPVGDDFGPGTYKYPANEIFASEGLFDITNFAIRRLGENYRFEFTFNQLNDPWNSQYGFSLPLIHLYLANDEDNGSYELFQEGANVRLNPKYPWNRLIQISGWWVRLYTPNMEMESFETDFLDVRHPAELEDPDISIRANTIILNIEKELLGNLEEGYFYLLVGGFDPFGPDHFRTIRPSISSWYFADLESDNLEYAPRVLDIILPETKDQATILSDFSDDYPLIYPIYFQTSSETTNQHIIYPIIVILILILLLVIIKNNKFPLFNNK
ncbi:glucodextranase DOMON-like domain-containing protein [Natronospora cellulosivora (SeqCode)]